MEQGVDESTMTL